VVAAECEIRATGGRQAERARAGRRIPGTERRGRTCCGGGGPPFCCLGCSCTGVDAPQPILVPAVGKRLVTAFFISTKKKSVTPFTQHNTRVAAAGPSPFVRAWAVRRRGVCRWRAVSAVWAEATCTRSCPRAHSAQEAAFAEAMLR